MVGVAALALVSVCHLLKGEKVARIQLKGALQVARGFFPMAFPAVDIASVFEYFGVVGQRAPGDGQLSAGTLVVAEAVVIVIGQGESAKAQAAFTAARSEVEKTVEKQPDFAPALSLLGMIDAGLGRKEEALREGRRACDLLPISKDAVDGPVFAANLAQIYAWIGEKDRAIKQIEAVERVPNYLSYGRLKFHPQWDSLRGDPRFEKIVASLAPKQ